jgi:8-oxo-dGTP pyrophosphatase MutT (NUDIX family)
LIQKVNRLWLRLLKPITLGVRLILVKDNTVLLVKHTYHDDWYLPGGGLKRHETIEEAARREAAEEIGAELEDLRLVGVYSNFQEFKSDHIVVFACDRFDVAGSSNREIKQFAFFPLDNLPSGVSPGTRRRLHEYRFADEIPVVGLWGPRPERKAAKWRWLSLCGIIAPLLFVFTSVLGGALRPGYSHVADTVSELFSPGSPNKLMLDALHTLFALLLTLFGVGIWRFVRVSGKATRAAVLGAGLYIAMGLVSVATAAVFPQDPWGSPPTFAGQMHLNLTGLVGLLSIASMLLIGIWLHRSGIWPRFGIYTVVTVGLVLVATSFFLIKVDSPIMGLAERISAVIGFQWTFTLAVWLSSRAAEQPAEGK